MLKIDYPNVVKLSVYGQVEVVGKCDVMAIAHHDSVLVYMLYTGAQTSIDAVRAKFSNKKNVWFGSQVGGKFSTWLNPNPENGILFSKTRDFNLRDDIGMVQNPALIRVNEKDKFGYVFAPLEGEAHQDRYFVSRAGQFIREMVNIQIFTDWFPVLVQLGLKDDMVKKTESLGCNIYAVSLDTDYWTKVVTSNLRSGTLKFPDFE